MCLRYFACVCCSERAARDKKVCTADYHQLYFHDIIILQLEGDYVKHSSKCSIVYVVDKYVPRSFPACQLIILNNQSLYILFICTFSYRVAY